MSFLCLKKTLLIFNGMQSILNLGPIRDLILLGKITVFKTVVIQKLFIKHQLMPQSFIKQLNKVKFRFISGFKWKKISKSKLCCNIEDGKAKIIDVKQYLPALKFKWIV